MNRTTPAEAAVRPSPSFEGFPTMTVVSEQPRLVTVFGGSGFVGRHIVRILAARGLRINVAVRRPDLAPYLQPLGGVGQIGLVQTNLRHPDSIAAAIDGADAVVNAVGVLKKAGSQTPDAVNGEGAGAVARAAAAAGVGRFVHLSSAGIDDTTIYGRSKLAGEAAVRTALPDAIILRPSAVFGPEDQFFNLFARLAALSPLVPLFGGATARVQPVYVEDVATTVAACLSGKGRPGTTYELGGPEVMTLGDCMRLAAAAAGRKPRFVGLPIGLARLAARLTGWLPMSPLSIGEVELMGTDSLVSPAAVTEGRDLAALGIGPAAVGAVVPDYLYRFRPNGQYDR
jgi:NADH dehydrogenase